MNRLLLAVVLGLAGAAALAASAVAMPVGRVAGRPAHAKTCHPQRGKRRRCKPTRRHGTRSTAAGEAPPSPPLR
jgi:hypothetical protein